MPIYVLHKRLDRSIRKRIIASISTFYIPFAFPMITEINLKSFEYRMLAKLMVFIRTKINGVSNALKIFSVYSQ